jgi:hypothetical protein
MFIFFSLYPISAIASGLLPLGALVAHPIKRGRQKEDKEIEADDWLTNNRT